jgi:uncharacterized membrane protein
MKEFIGTIFSLAVTIGIYAIEGGIVMLAWNASLPHLFSLPSATWANGVGLVFLANATLKRRPIDKPQR